ncbi:MAG TPA: hypothetical protein PLC13_02955 [Bacillota bacterium]|nr:hypothetical protein [Bacillota bacterium]
MEYRLYSSRQEEKFENKRNIILSGQKKSVAPEHKENHDKTTMGFFCVRGYAVLTIEKESVMLKEGYHLLLDLEKDDEPELALLGEGEVLTESVFYDGPEMIPEEKGTLGDFAACIKIANSRFRGSRFIFRDLKDIWYDQALQKAIKKIEKTYITFIAGLAGLGACAFLAMEYWGKGTVIPVIIVWLLLDFLIINPLIYFTAVPKPVKAHIKKIEDLSEYEKKVCEKETSPYDERAQKILKKYKWTGRN